MIHHPSFLYPRKLSRTFLNTKFCDENPLMNYYYYYYFYLVQLQLLLLLLLLFLLSTTTTSTSSFVAKLIPIGKKKIDLIIIDI
jgi:hypothetical protein